MSRRVVPGVVVSAGALLMAPAHSLAASGGSGIGPAPVSQTLVSAPPVSPPGGTIDTVQPGSGTVSATRNGITIATPVSGLLQNQMKFTGTLPATAAGVTVEIERLGFETNWTWAPTAHATAGANGAFTVVWRANHIGRFQIRAVVAGTDDAGAASASPTVTTIVYRLAIATQYGPGLYGNTTACGEVLRQRTLGTANRTLPCGTLVALYYQGRTMVVPVIDRGPYANGADWDLTEATGRALGIAGTATIGAVSLPPPP